MRHNMAYFEFEHIYLTEIIHPGDNYCDRTSEAPMVFIIFMVINGHIIKFVSIGRPVLTVYSTFYELISSIFLIGISIYAARL